MWKDVVNVNQENILIAMDAMMKKLEQMRESVLKNDFSKEFALAKNFKENDLNPNKEQK
jgi:prephenate dehydrogenase